MEHRSRVDAAAGVSPTSLALRRPLAITVGEPAGIGPDLCVLLAQRPPACPLVVVGNADLLSQRARQLELPLHLIPYTAQQTVTCEPGHLHVWDQALAVPAQPGVLDARNADAVLHWLRTAAAACCAGHFSGMVTAPVHKGIINDAGVQFSGHTEYLAELTGTQTVVMMLAGANMRVALATTHLPLRAVPDAITQASLEATLRVLHRELVQRFRLSAPRILVAGLNPHAGEGGYLGDEEVRVIAPVLERLRHAGMELIGPLPADTLFTPAQLSLCLLYTSPSPRDS